MTAATAQLEWLDVDYMPSIVESAWTLRLGPGLDGDHRWYVNPELHSGSFFWYGHYDAEVRVALDGYVAGRGVHGQLRVAALSAVSRPPTDPDPYFYDWRFVDLIARTHRDMRVASLGTVRHVELAVAVDMPRRKRDWRLGYVVRLEDYAGDPALRSVQHAIRVGWR